VKSIQLAAPALVSRHVTILVPVGIDLCRKREWDLTHISHLKQFIVKVCQCTIVDVRRTVTLFKYLLIQNRMVHSPTHSPMTWTIDPSSLMARSVCVALMPLFSCYPSCQAMWTCLNRGGVDAALLPVVIDRFS